MPHQCSLMPLVARRADEREQGRFEVDVSLKYLPDVAIAVVPYSNA